jgi:hypothetical protein
VTQVVIDITASQTFVVPADCVLFDSIECVGPGYAGIAGDTSPIGANGAGGSGGGGGAYAAAFNRTASPGASLSATVGTQSSVVATNFASLCVAAAASGPTGGPAASCVGDTKTAGNNGAEGGAPGGAGGPGGTGGTGGAAAGPYGGSGGAGGAGVAHTNGDPGSPGLPYGGGGGGGGGGAYFSGQHAGGAGGPAYQGFIRIKYTPFIPIQFNMPMLGM